MVASYVYITISIYRFNIPFIIYYFCIFCQARFRVYGIVSPEFPPDPTTPVDLAYIGNGARAVACSDQHYAKVENILLPGTGVDMSDGWETKRNRQKNHRDWVIVKLADAGYLTQAEIDTAFFIGNYPESASLEGCFSESVKKKKSRLSRVHFALSLLLCHLFSFIYIYISLKNR